MFKFEKVASETKDMLYAEYSGHEKIAMDIGVILPALVGTVAGGVTSNKMMNKQTERIIRDEQRTKLTSDYYTDIGRVFEDLKVIFTPINVIYTVGGQTFEIISVKEMNEEMKEAHRNRDKDFYAGLIINKMNMELQMAERHFARRMLDSHINKQAGEHTDLEILYNEIENNNSEILQKYASFSSTTNVPIEIPLNLDLLRPFDELPSISKVANLNTSFEAIQRDDFANKLEVAFLPDRVIYLYDKVLIEQMTVTKMNEEGFAAFRNRDKKFFKRFFNDFTKEVSLNSIEKKASEQLPSFEKGNLIDSVGLSAEFSNGEFYKTAATLDDIRQAGEWGEILAYDLDFMNIFLDSKAHPIVYDMFLDDKFGGDWHDQEIESLLKKIEVEYTNNEAIDDAAFNKILLLHTLQDINSTLLMNSFTFEKFVRAMNGKTVQVSEVEGNLEFEEILFALEIAESVCDRNIYIELTDQVAAYISTQLIEDDIRSVSRSIYASENEFKEEFWDNVNGFLTRKWMDKDSKGLFEEESTASREITVFIPEAINQILEKNAQLLDFNKPSLSSDIVTATYFGGALDKYEEKEGIIRAIANTIYRHLIAVMFLEIKKQEAEFTLGKMQAEYAD